MAGVGLKLDVPSKDSFTWAVWYVYVWVQVCMPLRVGAHVCVFVCVCLCAYAHALINTPLDTAEGTMMFLMSLGGPASQEDSGSFFGVQRR